LSYWFKFSKIIMLSVIDEFYLETKFFSNLLLERNRLFIIKMFY